MSCLTWGFIGGTTIPSKKKVLLFKSHNHNLKHIFTIRIGIMSKVTPPGISLPDNYCGKILGGDYSPELQKKVATDVTLLSSLDEIKIPVLIYLAAWKENENTIWYEFVSQRFLDLMGCGRSEIDGAFRNSVISRQEYQNRNDDYSVGKDNIDKQELSSSRKKIRLTSRKQGFVEAVYKLLLQEGRAIWLKDQANIETYKTDNICISTGCMTVLSKEMAEAEKNSRLIARLQEILTKNKIDWK